MLEKVLGKVWLFFIILLGTSIYQLWEEHNTQLSSLKDQLSVLEMRIKKAEKKRKRIKKYLSDIEEAKKQIDLVAIEVEKVSRQLPSKIDDTKNLALLKKMTSDLNVKKVFLRPLNEENRNFFFAKRYEVTGMGTYLQFLIMMEKIGLNNDHLLNVSNITFTRPKEKQRGRFQVIDGKMIVEAYRYNGDYKEEREIEEIQKRFKEKLKDKKMKKKKGKSKRKV